MPVHQFSLLVQSAGTALLFIVFVLLYQKIRRRAFLDWIASWAFLFASLTSLFLLPFLGQQWWFIFFLHACVLAHALLLLRGVRRFRDERLRTSRWELLWIVPIVALAWWTSVEQGLVTRAAPVVLATAIAYAATGISFMVMRGSPGGRFLLSGSFLLWATERASLAYAIARFGAPDNMPGLLQYSAFLAMFLEMTIAVGIIILLFEASQTQLADEMHQLVSSDQELKEKGIRDPLTGLYNRHYFNDIIRRELASARRFGTSISALLVDVDRFKEINDVKGHAVGDDVLRFVANYLTACVREADYVFRWGGDEFLIILTKTDGPSAEAKAEELVRRLPNIPGTDNLQPTLSVGWASHRSDVEFPITLSEADSRMYEMKLARKRERADRERDRELLGEGDRRFEPAGPSRS
ncbi:MAG TPA: GGDEF domain-containing protein [Thermoanaerobaculia bacterium]|nr:GGDEF domain-containing protein [Thermoanaerobaculia bacterium]